ncbi:hypothetical protein [Cytophaga sp. FL35]|nr:hypothetical protein [Cytophaga sp. FL35]MBC6999093.1 hypothetical protein [Cytophaga sp. FL35]
MKQFFIKLALLAFFSLTTFSCSVESELEDLTDEIERVNHLETNSLETAN